MTNKESTILEELKAWREEEIINQESYDKLSARYRGKSWDFGALMKWALVIGVLTFGVGVITFTNFLFDSVILVLVTALITAGGYYLGFMLTSEKFRHFYPRTGQAVIAAISLVLCSLVFALGKLVSRDTGNWPVLLLVVSLIYFFLAYFKRNNMVLIFAIIAIATWFGTQSGYVSGWGAYFLGLNYPMRFAILSPLVILLGLLHKKYHLRGGESFARIYYSFGLLYLNLSLWIMSIFGNYGDLRSWSRSTKSELLVFSLLWLAVCIVTLVIGARYRNKMFIGYSIVFIFINLYTRYFEYFWNRMHMSLFFLLIGVVTLFAGFCFERRIKKISSSQD